MLLIIQTIIYLFIGSYSAPEDKGINVYSYDTQTAETRFICGAVGISNPSFLCLSKNGTDVYAVGEEDSAETSTANSLKFDPKKGTLKLTGSQLVHGGAPCNIALSPNGRKVISANYFGGNITSFKVKRNGNLGKPIVHSFSGSSKHPERQTHPYLHGIYFTPDGKEMLCTDLGTDQIHSFPIDVHGSPIIDAEHQTDYFTKTLLGPRHLCFSPNRPLAYLIGELSGEVCTIDISQPGNLKMIQAIQVYSLGAKGSADIHISPDGKFVYASHRLEGDGISIMRVEADGTLTKISYQPTAKHPRNFAISPDGRFLLVASRDEGLIQFFSRDQSTGLLTDTGQRIFTHEPSCLKFFVPNN